ncbi:MAG: helix-turn-helix domain-containing protein [Lachnospiraceae bacterium]|nr:helix-turn-helix domain-containing protein [Lachnospiraceae bacterium]
MKIGERIKEIRRVRGMSVEEVAGKLGVSVSTLYRYENSSISKIPIDVIDRLCAVFGITAGELMGNNEQGNSEELPSSFVNAEQAMAFMLKMPVLAAYGGYDIESMDDRTIVEFANEILSQLRLVSYKYRNQERP